MSSISLEPDSNTHEERAGAIPTQPAGLGCLAQHTMDNQTTPKTRGIAHKVGTAAGTIALAGAGLTAVTIGGKLHVGLLANHSASDMTFKKAATMHSAIAAGVVSGGVTLYAARRFYKSRRKPIE